MSPLDRGAVIDPSGTYRYRLWRRWSAEPMVAWVMLNPSTADADVDDPTIRRCMTFARAWGYGGIDVVNLYALRATNPAYLWEHPDPIGIDNDAHIWSVTTAAAGVVGAWGVHGGRRGRGDEVIEMLARQRRPVSCLGVTKDGHPRHPLYTNGTTLLVPLRAVA